MKDTLFKQLGLAAVVIVLIGGFATTSSYGQALTTTNTVREPFSTGPFNPCIGEFLQVSGYVELVFHTTVNPDGTKSLEITQHTTGGLKGTTESGEPVVVSEVSHGVSSERGSGGVFHTNVHITLAVNGQQPNILVNFVLQTIINDDGTTKMERTHTNIRCVG